MITSLLTRTAKGVGPGKLTSPTISLQPGETTFIAALDANLVEYDDPTLLVTIEIEQFDNATGTYSVVNKNTFPGGFHPKGGGFPAPGIVLPPSASVRDFRVSITLNKKVSVGLSGETK